MIRNAEINLQNQLLGKGRGQNTFSFLWTGIIFVTVSFLQLTEEWLKGTRTQPGGTHWSARPVICVLLFSKSFAVFSDNHHGRECVCDGRWVDYFQSGKNNLTSKFATRQKLQAAFLNQTSGRTKRALDWTSRIPRLSVTYCGRQGICSIFHQFPWV